MICAALGNMREELNSIERILNEKYKLKDNYEIVWQKYRKLKTASTEFGFSVKSICKFDENVEEMLHTIEQQVLSNIQTIQLKAEKLDAPVDIKNVLSFIEVYWRHHDTSQVDENEFTKFMADYKGVLKNNFWIILTADFMPPKSYNDAFGFFMLDVLLVFIQTFIHQIFFISERFAVFADRHFKLGNSARCNEYFVAIYDHLDQARLQFLGKTEGDGFLARAKTRLESVYALPFMQNNKNLKLLYGETLAALNSYEKVLAAASVPLALDKPPRILKEFDLSKAKLQTPISAWQPGAQVSYAVQYRNNKLYSMFGEWSEPYLVADAGNREIYLPTTVYKGTKLIFRKFSDKQPELIGQLTGSTPTLFHDIDRDLFNAAGSIDHDVAVRQYEVFKKNGANPKATFEEGRCVMHAAAFAANSVLIQSCLIRDERVDLNARDNQGCTALHIAAELGFGEVVELLLKHGADANAKTNSGELTPMHMAALKNNDRMVEVFLASESINPNTKDAQGFTPLHCAVLGGVAAVAALIGDTRIDMNVKSRDGLTPLHLAVLSGDVAVAEYLLKSSAVDVEATTAGGLTAFHLAVLLEGAEMMLCLLSKRNIDINAAAGDKLTALHYAVATKNKYLVSKLLKLKKINLNATALNGVTPLHLAVRFDLVNIVENLLSAGAAVNAQTEKGLAPLHVTALFGCCLKALKVLVAHRAQLELKNFDAQTALLLTANSNAEGKLEFIEFLLNSGADINAKDKFEWNLLHHAAYGGDLEIIKFLVEQKNYDLYATDSLGETPLVKAARHGKLAAVQYFVESRGMSLETINKQSLTILHAAAACNSLDTVKYLLEKGADIYAKNDFGWTPLHYAASYGNLEIIKFLVEEKNFRIYVEDDKKVTSFFGAAIEYFFKSKGMNLAHKNSNGRTALHEAARSNKLDTVKYLLEKSADINVKDNFGGNLLHHAACGGNLEMIKFLVEEKHFDIYDENIDGETPLFVAARYGNLQAVEYFVENKKMSLEKKNKFGESVIVIAVSKQNLHIVKFLIEKVADMHATCDAGRNLLHYAAWNGDLDMIKFLVEQKKFDVNVVDNFNETPLFQATKMEKNDVIKYLTKIEDINLEHKNIFGATILHEAVRTNKLDTVKFLIEKGANINAKDYTDRNALHYAASGVDLEIIKFLLAQKNFDVHIKDNNKETALFIAVRYERLHAVKYLMEKFKIGLDYKNNQSDETVLDFAKNLNRTIIVQYLADIAKET